jgi:serine/threonine-protein kinase
MTAADTIKDIHVDVKRCPDCGARFGVDAAFCPFDGVPLAAGTWDPTLDPLKGKVIDGRYEVIGPLGEGGMGTVYKVKHVTLNRFFAMKVLRRDLATDADLAARFVQEARATAAIKHACVVAIIS